MALVTRNQPTEEPTQPVTTRHGLPFVVVTILQPSVGSVGTQIYYHATMGKSWATNFVYDQWPGVVLMIGRLVVRFLLRL